MVCHSYSLTDLSCLCSSHQLYLTFQCTGCYGFMVHKFIVLIHSHYSCQPCYINCFRQKITGKLTILQLFNRSQWTQRNIKQLKSHTLSSFLRLTAWSVFAAVCCPDCKAPWGKNYINKTDLNNIYQVARNIKAKVVSLSWILVKDPPMSLSAQSHDRAAHIVWEQQLAFNQSLDKTVIYHGLYLLNNAIWLCVFIHKVAVMCSWKTAHVRPMLMQGVTRLQYHIRLSYSRVCWIVNS